MRVGVDLRRFPSIRKLALDYAFNFQAVADFYAGDPSDRRAWSDAIARVQADARSDSPGGVTDVVTAQQRRRGAPPESIAAAERLRDSRTVAIVTGQQAGLFGGPLFTLLKAVTAIQLAERVAREHHVQTVAVFWIDAEDHDWNEVGSCEVLDAEYQTRTVTLARPPGAGEVPFASVRLDAAVARAIDELAQALPVTEFTEGLLSSLRSVYAPGAGMVDAFGRWLESLLGSRGLVVYDSSDPAAKPLAGAIFAKEIGEPGRTSKLAARAGAELQRRGYHAQVSPHDDSLALFHLDGGRRAIRQQGDLLVVGDATRPASGLLTEAVTSPAAFSPNVLLRPIVQDSLFPTICYVAGPNELGYLGQLRDVYDHFSVPMPLMYPRASATILDSSAARFLTRYDLPFETLQPQNEAALNQLLATRLPLAVERSLQETVSAIETRMAALIAAVPQIDPTLEGAARSALGRMQHDLRTLHTKIIQAAKRRDDTLRRQFTRARVLAFPGGRPQERAVAFVSFLDRYGSALVDRLVEELPLEMGKHWVITV